jgi:hypothetical protein
MGRALSGSVKRGPLEVRSRFDSLGTLRSGHKFVPPMPLFGMLKSNVDRCTIDDCFDASKELLNVGKAKPVC